MSQIIGAPSDLELFDSNTAKLERNQVVLAHWPAAKKDIKLMRQ
ncbi:unnamed protein product [marine sediment metagenome]|uniref:Uncharacterized protein n=1 Tax=marine sediment metagenome TaxID=412755 RepID=X1DM71_9ZZZZ